MPAIDLSILNQRQTPAFYADVFANRPAAGFVGRIFVSTDTYAFYRDNGTGWDLIGGPGTGTVTGSGAAGQVAFWSGSSLISGENNLWWDSTNNHFGINTNTPGTAADIHHNQSTILQLNQTTATNDTRIAFQNSGTSLWRIGNFYNGGANDLGIFDVVGNIQPVTVKKNTGQVLIGTSTVGAGKLVVASASSDNGIQIVGASAPSLRIDSAESGPTKRAGLGISTATNNFIQGSADRDFCIFNGSTAAASPILFGIYDAGAVNVQEAARISASRNLLVGQTADTGQTLQVTGSAAITGITQFSNTGAFVGFPGVTINQGSGTGIALSITKAGNNEGLYINKISGTGNAATILGNVGIGASSFTSPSGADTILGVYGGQDCSLILQDAVQLWEVYVNDDFYINRNATNVLQLSRTTGAATFSSSVTANEGLTINKTSGFPISNFTTNGASEYSVLYINNSNSTAATVYLGTGGNSVSNSGFRNNAVFGTPNAANITFLTSDVEKARITAGGNLLLNTSTDAGYKLVVNGSTIIGNPATNTTYGGVAFFNLFVLPATTTIFFQVPTTNWAGITEITWVSAADSNRAGAALLRWAYDTVTNTTGLVYTVYNDNQNAVATFDFSSGYLRLTITGGGSAYYVQFRIQGSQAV